MNGMKPAQFPESMVGGDSLEAPILSDPTTKTFVDKFLYHGGGGGYGDEPMDRAVDEMVKRDRLMDPEGSAKRQKQYLEEFQDYLDDVKREQWLRSGKPVEGPLVVRPTPQTAYERRLKEEMRKEGYESAGRDRRTGNLRFERIPDSPERPWFLGLLPKGYWMVGTVIHYLPESPGVVGIAQRLETKIGEMFIGEIRGGNSKLKAVYENIKNATDGKYNGTRVLEVLGGVPVLKDTSYALWVGHMQGLTVFQQHLMEDGLGTDLLSRFIEEYKGLMLSSEDDFADVLVSVLGTLPPELRSDAALCLGEIDARSVIQNSLEAREIKIPAELRGSLDYLGIDAHYFEEVPYVKRSRAPNRVLNNFSNLIAQTTYARLADKLLS